MNRRKFITALGLAPLVIKFAPALKFIQPEVAPVVATLGEWDNYASFSSHALDDSMDEAVMKVAEELGYRAGLSISAIYNQIFDSAAANV